VHSVGKRAAVAKVSNQQRARATTAIPRGVLKTIGNSKQAEEFGVEMSGEHTRGCLS
jgi:hypothetical protein